MGARASCQDCESGPLAHFEDCGASPSTGPSPLADGDFQAEMPDGSVYEGQFSGWERHGSGRLTWACGDRYEGQFSHNAMHGYGTMRWANGVAYRGDWSENAVGPSGTMTWPDGREYRGRFANGEKEGHGSLRWPGGRVYAGQWKQGKQDGYGFITVQPGPSHLCEWSTGKLKRWLAEVDLAAMPFEEQAIVALASGAVRLMRAAWLLKQPEDFLLRRCQDMPEEAFLQPEEAVDLVHRRYGIIVVSYTWLTRLHPDPKGFHIGTFRKYLLKHVEYFTGFAETGVFWDFACMHQRGAAGEPRSEESQCMWQVGLRALGCLYGGKRTVVVKLTCKPEGCEAEPYEHRGWCFAEATLCGILKESDLLLDLGISPRAVSSEELDWDQLRDFTIGARHPPVLPEDMKEALSKKAFGDGEDAEVVMDVYASFFAQAAPTVIVLGLANAEVDGGGWGDAEMKLFCRALPMFTRCRALSLANHTNLSKAGIKPLHGPLKELKSLQRLIMPQHLESSKEGKALAKEWTGLGKSARQLVWMNKDEAEREVTEMMSSVAQDMATL